MNKQNTTQRTLEQVNTELIILKVKKLELEIGMLDNQVNIHFFSGKPTGGAETIDVMIKRSALAIKMEKVLQLLSE